MPVKLEKQEGQLALSLSGHPDFQGALAAVKAVPGRRWDPDNKKWCFPMEPGVAERLMVTVKPEVSAEVLAWIKQTKSEMASELVTPLPPDADVLIPWGNDRAPWQPESIGKPGEEVPFKGLFAYQRAFVADAGNFEGTVPHVAKLLADDMGLGKCGQSSSAVMEYLLSQSAYAAGLDMPVDSFKSAEDMLLWAGVDDGPKLVIAPASVKGSWSRELRMWLGQDIPHVIVDGTPKQRKKQIEECIALNGWVIVNWEQIRTKKETQKVRKKIVNPKTGEFLRWHEQEKEVEVLREPLFSDTPWVAVIADEAHRAKNRKSLQAKGLWRIQAPFKLALTGTPLMNTPDELWPVLKWLYPEQYTSYWRFFDEYVDYYEGQYGKIITGVKNSDALRFELSKRLIRRTKGEVLDLPEKVRKYVPIVLGREQRKMYSEAENEMWFEVQKAIEQGDKSAIEFAKALDAGRSIYQIINGASRIVRLRQIASTPALLGGDDKSAKLDAAVEIISDAQPKQFVVFSEFVGTCNSLVERLRALGLNAEAYTGERTSEERTRLEDEFQAGDIDVIVGTIGAMKEGITLTAADTVIFVERHWTPAVNEQCEDRLHRVGQKNNVTVIILEAEETVDTEKVSVTNAIKHLIVSSVIQKDDVQEIR